MKRAGLPTDQLLHFYVAVIRPVVESCAPVWHYAINRAQAEQLESIQKRAIGIIFPFTSELPYSYTMFAANLISLDSRRHDLSKSFFETFATRLLAFTNSSHLHATLLFYPGLDQPCLSHA